jgi:hypothetical protein
MRHNRQRCSLAERFASSRIVRVEGQSTDSVRYLRDLRKNLILIQDLMTGDRKKSPA